MTTNEIPFLTGRLASLRRPNILQDVLQGNWHTWFNDQSTTKYLVHGVLPIDRELQAAFVSEALKDSKTLMLVICERGCNDAVGVISLKNIDLLNRNAEIGIVLGERAKPGIALEAMALMIKHAFDRLNLKVLYAGQHEGLWKWVNQLHLIGFRLDGFRENYGERSGIRYGVVLTSVCADRFRRLEKQRGGDITNPSVEELLRNRPRTNMIESLRDLLTNLESTQ